MTVGRQSRSESDPDGTTSGPNVSLYESRPGKFVFIESGNTDGWIATDLTIDLGE